MILVYKIGFKEIFNMSHIIVIREFRQSDEIAVRDVIKQSLLSLCTDSFISTLTKEITFQLVVMTAAVMFIFIGVPMTYCLISLPVVICGLYVCIYLNLVFKSMELFQEKPYQCWVAEACEPFFSSQPPEKCSYVIYTEYDIRKNNIELGTLQRKVVGSIALKKHRFLENSCWMYRLAVHKSYRHKGIAAALVHDTIKWAKIRGFDTVEVAFTENQDTARQLFLNAGFQLKQMYHKQMIGSAMTLLKYQFGLDLQPIMNN